MNFRQSKSIKKVNKALGLEEGSQAAGRRGKQTQDVLYSCNQPSDEVIWFIKLKKMQFFKQACRPLTWSLGMTWCSRAPHWWTLKRCILKNPWKQSGHEEVAEGQTNGSLGWCCHQRLRGAVALCDITKSSHPQLCERWSQMKEVNLLSHIWGIHQQARDIRCYSYGTHINFAQYRNPPKKTSPVSRRTEV